MFCEKCGTRVDDGQPFCPNCGNRLGAPNPTNGFAAQQVRAPGAALQGNIMGIPMMKLIFVGGACFLTLLGLIMSWCKVYGHNSAHYYLPEVGGTWLYILCAMLSTLAIAALVLYLLDKISDRRVLLVTAGVSCLIFVLLVIKWIAGGIRIPASVRFLIDSDDLDGYEISLHLSVAGWFMFFSELGAAALSVLGFLQAKKN
ncbi:MAG: zinc-ribbon domain-containing protein [Oscillospiraceae bacterium]|nr:zinc-ribbon domain-containing protein [Oscillospiraceae bacterium]